MDDKLKNVSKEKKPTEFEIYDDFDHADDPLESSDDIDSDGDSDESLDSYTDISDSPCSLFMMVRLQFYFTHFN
jgi:hypothetical protein